MSTLCTQVTAEPHVVLHRPPFTSKLFGVAFASIELREGVNRLMCSDQVSASATERLRGEKRVRICFPSSHSLEFLAAPPSQKKVVITNFVPPEEVSTLERRAQWNEEASAWLIPRLELAGNSRRMRRPISAKGLPRPETEYARHRKAYDSNPRWDGPRSSMAPSMAYSSTSRQCL